MGVREMVDLGLDLYNIWAFSSTCGWTWQGKEHVEEFIVTLESPHHQALLVP